MKKIISLLALGTATAFYTVEAQEQSNPGSTETSAQTYQQQLQNTQDQDKKKIEESALPEQVQQSLQESEYADMDIIAVYEVEESGDVSVNKEETMKWNEAQSQSSDNTSYSQGQQSIDRQNNEGNQNQSSDMNQTSSQDEYTRDKPALQPGEPSDAQENYVDKGVEYDSETGYSTSPGEEETYPQTEYSTSQADEDNQPATAADKQNSGTDSNTSTSAVESTSQEQTNENQATGQESSTNQNQQIEDTVEYKATGQKTSTDQGQSSETESADAGNQQSNEQQSSDSGNSQDTGLETHGEESQSSDQLNDGDQQRQNDQLDLNNNQNSQSQTMSSDNTSESEKMYEVQVEDGDKVMILVFTEEGVLRQATEDGM